MLILSDVPTLSQQLVNSSSSATRGDLSIEFSPSISTTDFQSVSDASSTTQGPGPFLRMPRAICYADDIGCEAQLLEC